MNRTRQRRQRLAPALMLAIAVVAAAPGRAEACVGDCDGNGGTTVDEVVTLVSLALGSGVEGCPAGDESGDGVVTVDEIVRALNNALTGCPVVSPRMVIGSARGAPGAQVNLVVSLVAGRSSLYAASIDIVYDAGAVRAGRTANGVDCSIAPEIGPGTASDKRLLLAVIPQDGGRELLRVGLISFTSLASLPDGAIFSCRFTIDPDATEGVVALTGTADGADEIGISLAVDAIEGSIVVEP